MTTMRERLIAAMRAEFERQAQAGPGYAASADGGLVIIEGTFDLSAVRDAVLSELATPDEEMVEVGAEKINFHDLVEDDEEGREVFAAFTAMIDHVREGK